MTSIEIEGFSFTLSVCPKNNDQSKGIESVSALLGLTPTKTTRKGEPFQGAVKITHDTWSWSYSSQWLPYWERGSDISFSDLLLNFLKSLPSDESIWSELNESYQYDLYIPLERNHFLIEVEFKPDVWAELSKRKLSLNLSALSNHDK